MHCKGITATNEDEKKNKLNSSATQFHPNQTATEIAKWWLKDIVIEEDDCDISKCFENGGNARNKCIYCYKRNVKRHARIEIFLVNKHCLFELF